MKLTKTYVTRTIWIGIIAFTTLLIVPVLASVLQEQLGTAVAGAEAPEPEDIALPAIEYDPAVCASYPVPG
ncbi:MAG: hypothetical protein C5B46_07400 [Proteobacteria bacterium]|nr:MAG: hypothetical protein C5B46_07400 [Pseudomonadota bacterium]